MSATKAPARGRADSPATTAAPLPLAALVLGVTAYLVHGVLTMDVPATATTPGPRFFPVLVAVVSAAVGIALVVQHLVLRRRAASAPGAPVAPSDTASPSDSADAATTGGAPPAAEGNGTADDDRINWPPVLLVGGSFLVFVLVLEPVGWLVSAALLFYGVLIGLGSRRWLADAGIALVFSAVVQLAFSGGLGLPLPAGILGGV